MTGIRPHLLSRLRSLLGRRHPEQTLRESIADLMQEAAKATHAPGEQPELDRHERALIANILIRMARSFAVLPANAKHPG